MSKYAMVGLVPVCLALACGGAVDDDGAMQPTELFPAEIPVPDAENDLPPVAPVEVVNEEILAEIAAGEETYTFLRLGEGAEAALAMRVQGAAANGSILQGLLDRDGELTLLEIFQALAPDREAPEALVESHVAEAAAMNRRETSVRLVEKTLPPPGVGVCDVSLFFFAPLTWTNQVVGGAASGGDGYVCVSNADAGSFQMASGQPGDSTCTFASTQRMMAGLCNNGSTTVTAYAGFGSVATWSTTATQSLPAGEYIRYDFAASSAPRRLAAVVLSSFGGGAGYGMRSGTAL